ncbi:MAG: hypothetical protein WC876_05220 [Candidatus Thermoplasmatota archaeon]|jgi:hypothetical protein
MAYRLDASSDPAAHDCNGDQDWRRFTNARALHKAWSAPPASPWSGYAKPTLFAAVEVGTNVAPAGWPALDRHKAASARVKLPEGAAVVLDLPGAWSVAMASWLARVAGLQPVVLANNWPHPRGVVPMQGMLAALLHYAPWVVQDAEVRAASALPVFVLDRDRLGQRNPAPGDFDNRYFLQETDLPSPAALRRAGVRNVIYVRPEWAPPVSPTDAVAGRTWVEVEPGPVERDDLNGWLVEVRKVLGLQVATADANEWRIKDLAEYAPALRKTVFTTVKDPAFAGFRRAAAGGFGRIVPEPSSGGGTAFG